jgi:3-deoxy-7-phosphoheptulonate synthase
MKSEATPAQLRGVTDYATAAGLTPSVIQQRTHTVIDLNGHHVVNPERFSKLAGVEAVKELSQPYKLTCRAFKPEGTTVTVNGLAIGGETLAIMAGPCAVESRPQMLEVGRSVSEAGVRILRGGAFKPRTSPYSFQGLGEEGLEILADVGARFDLAIITEVMAPEDVPLVARHADILQIGARNMQNYALLRAVGAAQRPVLLKRGMMATVEELLMAAEYVLSHGNEDVILCERGIRTFEPYTRNTLDISAVPVLKQLAHLPIIVDPSHGTGRRELVAPLSQAAVAAGADGLLVEVHPHPEAALSDGPQSLDLDLFSALLQNLRPVARAVGRSLCPGSR